MEPKQPRAIQKNRLDRGLAFLREYRALGITQIALLLIGYWLYLGAPVPDMPVYLRLEFATHRAAENITAGRATNQTEIQPARQVQIGYEVVRSGELAHRAAFPGAEGYGASATWGLKARRYNLAGLLPRDVQTASVLGFLAPLLRNVSILAATPNDSVCNRTATKVFKHNLNASGDGSLAAILSDSLRQDTLDIVVPGSAGTITVDGTLTAKKSCMIMAGQYAQGGIQIRGSDSTATLVIRLVNSHQAIRYYRIRPGRDTLGRGIDALRMYGALSDIPGQSGLTQSQISDHNSLAFAPDELLSIRAMRPENYDSLKFTTVQRTLLYAIFSTHTTCWPYGGGDTAFSSQHDAHHNLAVNCGYRLPKVGGTQQVRIVSNLLGGWSSKAALSSNEGNVWSFEFEHNHMRNTTVTDVGRECHIVEVHQNSQYDSALYIDANVVEDSAGNSLLDADEEQWDCVGDENTNSVPTSVRINRRRTDDNPPDIPISVDSALVVLDSLTTGGQDVGAHQYVDCSGAWQDSRDALDAQAIQDYLDGEIAGTRSTGYYTSPNDYGGYPSIETHASCTDTDGGGLPDAWEDAHGLNKNSAADDIADSDGDGYTNIEEYLNGTNPQVA